MDVKISKPSRTCTVCGHEFADGEELLTALNEESPGVFARHDICNRCWPKQQPESFYCHWTSEHTDRRKPALMDTDALWQVFHSSRARLEQEPSVLPFHYVAALGLMRLRKLELLEESTDGEGVQIMRFRTKGKKRTEYALTVPKLAEAEVARIEEEIADFADGEPDNQSGDDGEGEGDDDES